MRISDWSSDVYSSEAAYGKRAPFLEQRLIGGDVAGDGAAMAGGEGRAGFGAADLPHDDRNPPRFGLGQGRHEGLGIAGRFEEQIGRAAGREQGGQWV